MRSAPSTQHLARRLVRCSFSEGGSLGEGGSVLLHLPLASGTHGSGPRETTPCGSCGGFGWKADTLGVSPEFFQRVVMPNIRAEDVGHDITEVQQDPLRG